MIPTFSPPPFTQPSTLKRFSDLAGALDKVNLWISYATNYIQSQLVPPLNNNVVGLIAPLSTVTLEDRVAALEREVAELKARL